MYVCMYFVCTMYVCILIRQCYVVFISAGQTPIALSNKAYILKKKSTSSKMQNTNSVYRSVASSVVVVVASSFWL